jgi:hypothetical protein
MKISVLSRRAPSFLVAAAMLAGCGVLRQAQNDTQPPTSAAAVMAVSWMTPQAPAQNLLYLAGANDVTVYSYPQGKLEGTLDGFSDSGGDCVDKAQDVWITDQGHARMVEYAHGRTQPLRILKGIAGNACAVDPVTGDLAITTVIGTIYVYKGGRGEPVPYDTPDITRFNYCGYDDKGNLFADGGNGGNNYSFVLSELPKGSGKLRIIGLNQPITEPGGVAWDGKHLAIGDSEYPVIYEFALKADRGTRVRTTTLGSPGYYVSQFFIDGQSLIAPNNYLSKNQLLSDLLVYKYPNGGKPSKNIPAARTNARGVVLSLAQSR